MTRLRVGDRVSNLSGSHDGKLVEIDGTTGCVMQDNGVENEFPLDQLKPYGKPEVAVQRTLAGPLRDRILTPAQKAFLASVPAEVTTAIARSYEAGGETASSRTVFAALPASKKLDIIRIYLPSLPHRLLVAHMSLVVALRDLAKSSR